MNGKVTEVQLAYLHGYFESKIEGFAETARISKSELTVRLGALLLGMGAGFEDRLSVVRGDSTSVHKTTRKVEMAERPSGKTQKKTGKGSYWQKMTPLQRRKEMRRRMQVTLDKKKHAA